MMNDANLLAQISIVVCSFYLSRGAEWKCLCVLVLNASLSKAFQLNLLMKILSHPHHFHSGG